MTPEHYMILLRDKMTGRLLEGYSVGHSIHFGDAKEAGVMLGYFRGRDRDRADDYFIM